MTATAPPHRRTRHGDPTSRPFDQHLLLIWLSANSPPARPCTSTAARRQDIDAPGIPALSPNKGE